MTILQDNRLTPSDIGIFYYIKGDPRVTEHDLILHFQHCSVYLIRQSLTHLYNLGYLTYQKSGNNVILNVKTVFVHLDNNINSSAHSKYNQNSDLYQYFIKQFHYQHISHIQELHIKQCITGWLNHYSAKFIKNEINKITNNNHRVQNIKYPLAYVKVSLYSDSHHNMNQYHNHYGSNNQLYNNSDGFTIRRATPSSKFGRFLMSIIDKHIDKNLH